MPKPHCNRGMCRYRYMNLIYLGHVAHPLDEAKRQITVQPVKRREKIRPLGRDTSVNIHV